MTTALIVIDVQQGFDNPYWGQRNNPNADANIQAIVERWAEKGEPIVVVRHESRSPESPLHPDAPGNALKPYVAAAPAALSISKRVNSAFHGEPDLDAWLTASGIDSVVIVGIQTNMCCETTARMAGNLGYSVIFVTDATHTFSLAGPDGRLLSGDELARSTETNLYGGGFARIVTTGGLLAETAV